MEKNQNYTKTKYLTLCGLFAALTAICSWISIPLGFTPIPINLATLAVLITGGLLGPKYGPLSITVYAFAGAVGVPVFAGFRGGLSVLAGPTGGYILGYIAAAFIAGLLCCQNKLDSQTQVDRQTQINQQSQFGKQNHSGQKTQIGRRLSSIIRTVAALILALVALYVAGTLWFIISTNTNIAAALVSCVFPFLPGEAIKVTVGTILIRKLRKFI